MRKVPFSPAEFAGQLAGLDRKLLIKLYSEAYDQGYTGRKQAQVPGRSNEPAKPTEETVIDGEPMRADLLALTNALISLTGRKKHLEKQLGAPAVVVNYRPRRRRRRRQGYGALAEEAFGVRAR